MILGAHSIIYSTNPGAAIAILGMAIIVLGPRSRP